MTGHEADPTTLVGWLERRASLGPDEVFVACGKDRRTFRDLDEASRRLAGGLQSLDVGEQDRVAILLGNQIEMVDTIFALARLRAIQVPLNMFLKGEFLRYQLHDCTARTVITDRPGLEAIRPLRDELPDLEHVVVVDDHDYRAEPGSGTGGVESYTGLIAAPPVPDLGAPRPDDILAILYTSGTTGFPKGCMVTHGYYQHTGRAFADMLGATADDVLFTALPLYHLGGQGFCLMVGLLTGCAVSFEAQFSATRFFARAAEERATLTMGAGPMAAAILATPPSPDDRSHRIRRCGFAPLPPAAQLAFEARFGVEVFAEVYAQSECSPVSFPQPGDPRHRDRAGRPAPWLEVRLVDDGDHEVPIGTVGEISIRPRIPHAMFSGYWGKPEATLETFRNLWHHTGDLGRFDEDGFLSFVDRKKDAMRRRGENVSSLEVEAAISRMRGVAEVAVHGVPSPLGEDDIKACIVIVEGAVIEPDGLFGQFREALPYFAIPRFVEVLDALPKNFMGRVMKDRLRERGVTDSTWDFEDLGLTVNVAERR